MNRFDVFNGDADGICALHQLRLAAPAAATLVTGVKRDIGLLARVPAQRGDAVTALDISAATNRDALVALLERGVAVDYFDHHHPGRLPEHPLLRAWIDTSPQVCTGIVVDRHLGGRHRPWAIVAAYGDNLLEAAEALATTLDLPPGDRRTLRALGEALAYNAYGDTEDDLLIHPAALYRLLSRYADPQRFIRDEPLFAELCACRERDLALARSIAPAFVPGRTRVYVLPDAAWSRRVRGAIGNELANAEPELAHVVATPNVRGNHTVSVRAPLARRHGADALCREFGGDGRAAAAGINDLPPAALPELVRRLERAF